MFVQVITGRTGDGAALRAHAERWRDEVLPGATGCLGGTFGIADDGTVVALARFADEAAAAASSARAEQDAWWKQAEALFEGEATFRDSTDVSLLFDGGSDQASFVQIMEGTVADRAEADAAETPELLEQLRTARPDLLGGIRVWFDGGAYLEAAYFTSEDDARKGEATPDFEVSQEGFAAQFGDPTYTDLRDPLLFGAA